MDLLILGTILLVLVMRLRDILGERSEDEKPPRGLASFNATEEAESHLDKISTGKDHEKKATLKKAKPVVAVLSAKDEKIYESHPLLKDVVDADPEFSVDEFLKGAKYAFTTIIEAFTQNSLNTIGALLSPKVRGRLRESCRERAREQQRRETHVVSVDKCEIVDVSMEKGKVYLTVRFISTQINALYDVVGKLIEGDPQKMHKVADRWTFVRSLGTQDPNWTLADIHQS